jgi:hypothetical protein
MRQLSIILLLAAFLMQCFSKTFIVADYYVNTSSFAQNCENKARPMMHCNGKCQMMKKLKEEENREKQNAERKGDGKTEIIADENGFAGVEHITITLSQSFVIRNNNLVKDMAADIFHPPAV